MSKVNSAVPAALTDYHQALIEAQSAPDSTTCLQALWRAFQFYIEPEALAFALQIFAEWPHYRQALAAFASAHYPQYFPAMKRPPTGAYLPFLQSWHEWLWPTVAPRLGIGIMVRNGLSTLPDTLRSLEPLQAEIMVLDTGSDDGTWAYVLSQDYLRAEQIVWSHNFSWVRNQLLKHLKSDWVFMIDADESLDSRSIAVIESLIQQHPLGWQVYSGEVHHQLDDGSIRRAWVPRLFRREGMHYVGVIHELPVRQQAPWWTLPVYLPYILKHSGYLSETVQRQRKSERVRMVEQAATAVDSSPYLRYQLAHLLAWGMDCDLDLRRATALVEDALHESFSFYHHLPPRANWLSAPLPGAILLRLQLAFWQGDDAFILSRGLRWQRFCPYREFWLIQAMSALRQGQISLARNACYQAWDPDLWSLEETSTWQRQSWELLLDSALAQECALEAIFALRRLQEHWGRTSSSGVALDDLEVQLLEMEQISPGRYLSRLHWEGQYATSLEQRCWALLAALMESWEVVLFERLFLVLAEYGETGLFHALFDLACLAFPEQEWKQSHFLHTETMPVELKAFAKSLLLPPRESPRCWVAMMVKDAEETLSEALASVAWADRWLIVDTGSQDQTLELIQKFAQSHPVTWWQMPWPEDFSAVRQLLVDRAKCDWLLMLDADDLVTEQEQVRWKALLKYPPPRRQVGLVRYVSAGAEQSQRRHDWCARVFSPHQVIRYWGKLHEQIGHAWLPELWPVLALPLTLEHSGYLPQALIRHRKSQRLSLLRDSLFLSSELNPYFAYQYAAHLAHYQPNQFSHAMDILQKAWERQRYHQNWPPCAGWFPMPFEGGALLLARLCVQTHQYQAIWDWQASQSTWPRDPEYAFYLGQAAMKMKDWTRAKWAFQRAYGCSALAQRPEAGFATWRPLLGLLEVSSAQNDWAFGFRCLQGLMAHGYPDAQHLLAQWCLFMTEHSKALVSASQGQGTQDDAIGLEPVDNDH